MEKKRRFKKKICAAALTVIAGVFTCGSLRVSAEQVNGSDGQAGTGLQSFGNLIYEDATGKKAEFYASDIMALNGEIQKLAEEIR